MNQTGLWIEGIGPEHALSGPGALSIAAQHVGELGVSDVYLQVYRSGQAWFESALVERAASETAQNERFDPLGEALKVFCDHGVRVHAWVNVFNLGQEHSGNIIAQLGSDALLTDNFGVQIDKYGKDGRAPGPRSAYSQLGTPGAWLDPAHSGVFELVTSLVEELLSTYDQLSGLHLDFFRYPYLLPIRPSSAVHAGADFGYGQRSLDAFRSSSGVELGGSPDAVQGLHPASYGEALCWDDWRRERLDLYLRAFRKGLTDRQKLSVAVVPWADRAYLSSYQNWRKWLKQGSIDAACLMTYTRDKEMLEYLITQALPFRASGVQVLAGVGTYLLKEEKDITGQIELAERLGADGVILFSYRNLLKDGRDLALLSKSIS